MYANLLLFCVINKGVNGIQKYLNRKLKCKDMVWVKTSFRFMGMFCCGLLNGVDAVTMGKAVVKKRIDKLPEKKCCQNND